MKKLYCTKLDRPHEETEHCADGCVAVYLASEVDDLFNYAAIDRNKLCARIAELEKVLHYLREEIEGDGNPGWTTLVDRIDSVL